MPLSGTKNDFFKKLKSMARTNAVAARLDRSVEAVTRLSLSITEFKFTLIGCMIFLYDIIERKA